MEVARLLRHDKGVVVVEFITPEGNMVIHTGLALGQFLVQHVKLALSTAHRESLGDDFVAAVSKGRYSYGSGVHWPSPQVRHLAIWPRYNFSICRKQAQACTAALA